MLSKAESDAVDKCVACAEFRIARDLMQGCRMTHVHVPERHWLLHAFRTYNRNIVKTEIQHRLEKLGYCIQERPYDLYYLAVTYDHLASRMQWN
jgi:hypothetical protein